ncbi:hypothetical protein N7523_010580 [Penicillium sp. IBT 18751x]|nr:hypothetical protein N7523_010580 [Penicillium sp. IBT 18751x]
MNRDNKRSRRQRPHAFRSATESCVTIMCSSILVLRPLYVRVRQGKDGKSGSTVNADYKLPMYGNHSTRKYGKLQMSGPQNSNMRNLPENGHLVQHENYQ